MTDRLVRRLDIPSEERLRFSEFLHVPNIVLLGDPGLGKSHLFGAFAPPGGLLRARDFLNMPMDELRAQPILFIDALDEKRSSRTDVTAVDQIVQRLMELKPRQVRIACRAFDWLGASDLAAFRPYFASQGGPSVLALEALTETECVEVLTALRCIDPRAFVREAHTRGVADLLGNPQNLTMLYQVVQSRDWPRTRAELYRDAVELLLTEPNGEHIRKNTGGYSYHNLVLPAGAICAARLIADINGISLTSCSVDGYPSYRDLTIAPSELVLAALTRRAFISAGVPETVDYAHRTVAEYLAARFLAHQVQQGLPFERVRALISVGGRPATELRGLHAWLAVHLPDNAAELIAADPYGVLSYGDAAALTPINRDNLIQHLARLADSDPWFRRGNWSAAPLRGLSGPDMVGHFRKILHEGNSSHSLVSVVLDAATVGTPMPPLQSDFLRLLGDRQRSDGTRLRALDALLRLGPSAHRECAAAYAAISKELDSFQLRASVLRALVAVGVVGSTDITNLLNDALVAEPNKTSITSTALYNLGEEVPDSMVQSVLRHVSLQRLPKSGAHSQPAWEALRVLDILLARLLDLDAATSDYAAEWLIQRARATRNHGYTAHKRLQNVLKSDPERMQHLIDAVVRRLAPGNAWSLTMELQRVFLGAADADAILSWSIRRVRETNPPDPLHYTIALGRLWWAEPIRRAEFEYLLDLASQLPQLKPIVDDCSYCPIEDWRVEESNRRVIDAAQSALNLTQRRAEFDTESDRIRTGDHLGWMDYIAHIYLSLFADCDEHSSPYERLVNVLENGRTEVALTGLRAFVVSGRRPSLDDIIQAHAAEKVRRWWYAIVAGLDEYNSFNGNVEALSVDVLSSAIAIDILYPTWERVRGRGNTTQRPWVEWFSQKHPEKYRETVMKLVHYGLKVSSPYVYGFPEVIKLPDAARMRCVQELLHAYPLTARSYLTRLLRIWIKQSPERIDISLIHHGIAQSANDPEAHPLWLAAGLLLDLDEFKPSINALRTAAARKSLIWASRDLGGWDNGDGTQLEISIACSEYLLRLIFRCFERVEMPIDSAGDRSPYDAVQFARGLLSALANHVTDAAVQTLRRLLNNQNTKRFKEDIKHTIAQQQVRLIDTVFKQPTWGSTIETLSNSSPANIADLQALVLCELHHIQQHLTGGNTDLFKRFWNEKPHGGLLSPKSENSCRNVLVDELRTRLKARGMHVEPEGHMRQDRRTDIAVYYPSMKLVIELKRHYHAKVWVAAAEQLERWYVRDPEAQGFGIYGVIWFGKLRPTPGRAGQMRKPRSAAEMLFSLTDGIPIEQRERIKFFVLDVTNTERPCAQPRRSLNSKESLGSPSEGPGKSVSKTRKTRTHRKTKIRRTRK